MAHTHCTGPGQGPGPGPGNQLSGRQWGTLIQLCVTGLRLLPVKAHG